MYQHSSTNTSAIIAAVAAYGVFISIVVIVGLVVQWRIAAKAGYNGALSLLMLLPVVNFIVLLVFAFGEWPIERELKAARGIAVPVAWSPGGTNPPATF